MKYALEIPPRITTGRSKLISSSQLEGDQLTAVTEMISYRAFMQELVQDGADNALLDNCRRSYDIARDAALALGANIMDFPKHLKFSKFGGPN